MERTLPTKTAVDSSKATCTAGFSPQLHAKAWEGVTAAVTIPAINACRKIILFVGLNTILKNWTKPSLGSIP